MKKWLIYLILVAVLLIVGVIYFFNWEVFSSPQDCSLADVNNDGEINLVDSVLVKVKNGCQEIWQEHSVCLKYDLDLDGNVDKKDFRLLEECRIG